MALAIKKVSDIYEMKVFTDKGDYFGEVEESILTTNKVFGWKIKATKNSALSQLIGGAKGVIVPHQLVKAIGGIMIINRAAIPSFDESREEKEIEQ